MELASTHKHHPIPVAKPSWLPMFPLILCRICHSKLHILIKVVIIHPTYHTLCKTFINLAISHLVLPHHLFVEVNN
jgi:hypothetical protein